MRQFLEQFENNFNKFVEELKKAEAQLIERFGRKISPEIGDTVKIFDIEWLILDKTNAGYHAITKDFVKLSTKFDSNCNDWKASDLRKYLNKDFASKFDEGMFVEFERDLTSLDGQTEYGTCMDKVSLLTVDEYRKYRKLLPNTDKWWWLCTPWSTKCNDDTTWITVVSPAGGILSNSYYFVNGVRPFCIFSSEIFESEEE